MILVASNLKELVGAQSRAVVVENPHLAFAILSEYFARELLASKPQPAQISPSAKIMPNVYVGSGAVIGDNTLVMAGAYNQPSAHYSSAATPASQQNKTNPPGTYHRRRP